MGGTPGGTGIQGQGGITKNMEGNIIMKPCYNCNNLETGKKYYHGSGVKKNYRKAAGIFSRLAEQGDADAQNYLGFMYENGQGVKKDYVKAVEWYRKAAEQGYALAQYNLGYMYEIGEETGQDYVKAAEWFRKVAEQGNPSGAANLAELYDKGQGVPQDYAEAAKWYKIAAEHDIKRAQTRLGELYEKGLGVPQDAAKAAYWTKKGIYLRSWIFSMGTLFHRHNRCKKLNEVIAKITDPELKDKLIKTRDEYWNRIQQLNKPNFTDEDYDQIKHEHERIDELLRKWEK